MIVIIGEQCHLILNSYFLKAMKKFFKGGHDILRFANSVIILYV